MRVGALLAFLLVSAGCLGFNKDSNCRWPADHQARALELSVASDRRHLADDAQFAEDLAIRHADASRGRGSANRDVGEYRRIREQCKAELYAAVAAQHSVPPEVVAAAVGDRREWLDAIMIACLAIGFIAVARLASAFMLRGALADSRALAAGMILAAAIVAGVAAVMAGGMFIGLIESVRVGNGHMSYRVDRLPLRHRPMETFAAAAICFISVAAVQFARKRAN
jgi:hypothetical protein